MAMDGLPLLQGTMIEVATLLHEYGRADVTLAEACLGRFVALLPQSASARRDAFDSGAAHAIIVAMGAHLGASGGDVASGGEVVPTSALRTSCDASKLGCEALGHVAIGEQRCTRIATD